MKHILQGAVFLFLLSPLTAFSQSSLTNQKIYDTIPNLPDLYLERTSIFNAEPIREGLTIFLGNSITQGGDWVKLLNNNSVINRGIGGDNTYGVLSRMEDITSRKPSNLFILIGINDISKDIPVAVIADNYRQIIEKVQEESKATRIFVQSLLPLNTEYPGFPQHFDKKEKVVQLNELLKKLAQTTKVDYLDLEPIFMDSEKRLNEKLTYDGLHLNEQGYKVWADFLKKEGYIKE